MLVVEWEHSICADCWRVQISTLYQVCNTIISEMVKEASGDTSGGNKK